MAKLMDLIGDSNLDEIEAQWPRLGQWLRSNLIPALNNIGKQIGVSPVGQMAPPDAPQSVSVKVSNEMMHISINHASPVQKGIQYFTEISTSPSFSQPIVYHHGTSRTPPPIALPTLDDNGDQISYYVRSYAQNQGSQPSARTVAGGVLSPTAFTMQGGTQMTLLPSTGSGTAAANGQQGGYGLGRTIRRGPTNTLAQIIASGSGPGPVPPAITTLTGDVNAGPGSGSQAATVVGVNNAPVPASHAYVGTNASGQIIPAATPSSPSIVFYENVSGSGTSWTLANTPNPAGNVMLFGLIPSFGLIALAQGSGNAWNYTITGAAITTNQSFTEVLACYTH